MLDFNWYLFPSALTLAAKLWLLINATTTRANRYVLVFVASALALNILEFTSFFLLGNDDPSRVWVVRMYYAFGLVCAGAMYVAAEQLYLQRSPLVTGVAVLTAAAVACALNPLAVAGVEDIGYSFKAIPGPWYFTIVAPLVLLSIAVAVVLTMASRQQGVNGLRARVLLWGLMPTIIVCILVVAAMLMGLQMNAVLFMSTAFFVFTFTLVKHDQLTNFLLERQSSKIQPFDYLHLAREEGLEAAKSKLELDTINALVAQQPLTIDELSERLGVSRATAYRRLKALKELQAD